MSDDETDKISRRRRKKMRASAFSEETDDLAGSEMEVSVFGEDDDDGLGLTLEDADFLVVSNPPNNCERRRCDGKANQSVPNLDRATSSVKCQHSKNRKGFLEQECNNVDLLSNPHQLDLEACGNFSEPLLGLVAENVPLTHIPSSKPREPLKNPCSLQITSTQMVTVIPSMALVAENMPLRRMTAAQSRPLTTETCINMIPEPTGEYVQPDADMYLPERKLSCADDESVFGPEYFHSEYCHDDEDSPVNTPFSAYNGLESSGEEEEDDTESATDSQPNRTTKEEPIYDGATLTAWESLIAILTFMQSNHISGACLRQLLKLINLHLPQPNKFMKTNHSVFKLLEELDEPIKIHYYCSVCFQSRALPTDLCDTCTDETKSVHFFLQFPLEAQLKKIYGRPGFKEKLNYRNRRSKKNVNNIEDVFDGEIYREAEAHDLLGPFDISFLFNSDGVQIFTSTSYSLWPFFLAINELSPEQRFLSENLLIAGIWGSCSKPHPNVFLLPIYKELKTLTNGIEIKFHGEEETNKIRATVVCGSCDEPAKAGFLNMRSHNGFYSCHLCLIRGTKPGDATVFPYQKDVPLRNMPQYEEHVRLAVVNRVILTKNQDREEECRGIKGPTILSSILLNLFFSMAVDSMHCLYLGVMRYLLHLWFDKKLKDERFSVFNKIKLVNARIKDLAPPHFLQRLPQPIEKLCYWKASELRSFLFNIALVLLRDVLSKDYYDHFSLFVQGVALLNTESVSEEDLVLSQSLLDRFLRMFADLYGVDKMTHNLHMVGHLPLCVRLHGPLWAVSLFKFEDANGRVKNYIHGTRHVGQQIHSNMAIITQLPIMIHDLKDSDVKTFCESLVKRRDKLRISDRISSGTYCVGLFSSATPEIDKLLSAKNVSRPLSKILLFQRLLKERLLYVSMSYKSGAGARVSSFVKYDENKYGILITFVKVTCDCALLDCGIKDKYVAVIKPIIISQFSSSVVEFTHLHKCNYVNFDTLLDCHVTDVQNLMTVLFKIDLNGIIYLSTPLNKYELE